jgi:hypothetical protein
MSAEVGIGGLDVWFGLPRDVDRCRVPEWRLAFLRMHFRCERFHAVQRNSLLRSLIIV